MSVRERAAAALDDDFPAVLAALRRGLSDKDAGKAARTAIAYGSVNVNIRLVAVGAAAPYF